MGQRPSPRVILKTEGTVFPNTDLPRLANNKFIFSCGKLVDKRVLRSVTCGRNFENLGNENLGDTKH